MFTKTIPPAWFSADWLLRTWALVRLLRPVNVVMIMVGVVLGGIMAGGLGALQGSIAPRLIQAALSAAFIAAAANSLNDVLDLEIDQVNRPERPLPSGLVSGRMAKAVWGLGTGAGIVLAFFLSPIHVTLALAAVGLMIVYNAYLKRTLLLGNIVVALVIGLTLVYGGFVVGAPDPALLGAGFAFLTTVTREMIKDVEDMEGDAVVGARTLPLVYGADVATRGIIVVLFVTLFLTPLPFLLFEYRGLFLLLMLATDAFLLHTLWIVMGPRSPERARRASNLLKAAMVAGMIALAFGAIVQMGE